MPQVISQVQFKRSDKTLANLSTQKLKYGEPILLVNSSNRALVIGNSSENDTIASDYFIPLASKDTADKGYMVKGVDYVTAGKKSDTTLGTSATAEGTDVTASGDYSHAEGYNTTATHKSQHVFGEYNTLDASSAQSTARGTYVEIVGNGTAVNALSNARTLDWSGNETLAGKLTLGAAPLENMDATTKKYVDDKISHTAPGTVTSVQVQATTPILSSSSSASTSSLSTTISIADNYGDIKNPYAAKGPNLFLGGPSTANRSEPPTFRALAVADLPVIPVTKGGTGLTTATNKNSVITAGASATAEFQSVRTASGALYATAQDAAPSFGILPTAQGGTGKSSWTTNGITYASSTADLAQLGIPASESFVMQKNTGAPYFFSKSALFTSPSFTGSPTAPTAPVGTSNTQIATTAFAATAAANAASSKQAAKITTTATLTTSGWNATNKTQTINVSSVTASNLVQVSPAPANWVAAGRSAIYCSAQAAGKLIFTCQSIPTQNITINIVIWN